MSLPAKTLCINPNTLFIYKDNNLDVQKLANILNIPHNKLRKIINKNKDRKEYYLKRHVSKSIYLEISKLSNPNICLLYTSDAADE